MNADPIKYEVDKESGAMFVDRFMTRCTTRATTATCADSRRRRPGRRARDHAPVAPGVVVTCRPIGVLKMEDEAGGDAKLLAVPIDKILPIYNHWQKPEDMNEMRLKRSSTSSSTTRTSSRQVGQDQGLGRARGGARRDQPAASRRASALEALGAAGVGPASALNGRRSFSSSR